MLKEIFKVKCVFMVLLVLSWVVIIAQFWYIREHHGGYEVGKMEKVKEKDIGGRWEWPEFLDEANEV